MKAFQHQLLLAVSLLASGLVAANELELSSQELNSQEQGADHHGRCKTFHAQVIDSKTTEGCTSPLGFCSAGTIEGTRGMNGTIYSVLDSYSPGPSTTPEPSKTISFAQLSEFTLTHGTLTARETGISAIAAVDPNRRFFSGFGEFTAGTGRYAGATGYLYFSGKKIGNNTVTDVMTGVICLP